MRLRVEIEIGVRVEGESGGGEWSRRRAWVTEGGEREVRCRGGSGGERGAAPEAKQVARGRVARIELDRALKVLLVRVRARVRMRVRMSVRVRVRVRVGSGRGSG